MTPKFLLRLLSLAALLVTTIFCFRALHQAATPAKVATKAQPAETAPEDLALDPCTVVNPLNRGFIDLSGLADFGNEGKHLSFSSKGYDSGFNYTVGICSSPFKKTHGIEEIQDAVNASAIGAYYIDHKTQKYVSLGEYSTAPVFRGRKLTLTYNNGAYCDGLVNSVTGERLRKSTILTFTCDRDISSKASVSFIGTSNDCDYVFEVRSHHACPTAAKSNNMAAVWIFFLIVFAAIGVYFSGGVLYEYMKKK